MVRTTSILFALIAAWLVVACGEPLPDESSPLPVTEALPETIVQEDTLSEPQQQARQPSAPSATTSGVSYGPTTLEERILKSDVVVRARLQSKTPSERSYFYQPFDKRLYLSYVDFTFSVTETLKGTPITTAVVELKATKRFNWEVESGFSDTAAEAEQKARDWIANEYDAQWESRDAILFLVQIENSPNYSRRSRGRPANVQYAFVGHSPGSDGKFVNGQDSFSITSDRNKAWLPATEVTASSTASFYLDAPSDSGDAPTSSLASLKTTVTTTEAMVNNAIAGHRVCLITKLRDQRIVRPAGMAYVFQRTAESGQPANTVVSGGTSGSQKYEYIQLYGDNAHLFSAAFSDTDTDPTNGYDRTIKTTRPLPNGRYEVEVTEQRQSMVPCGYIPPKGQMTLTVVAPEGTLHELLFDPVTVGSGVAADATNGVLKPASFTDANSASATLSSITYESTSTGSGQSGTVKVEVTPDDALAGQVLDIIELDGTVSLSLYVADATVDSANDTLSWSVSSEPWEDGDQLMVRIR